MASNSFGNLFRITTWGESHGKAVGVVIDGCPAGVALSVDDINRELVLRAPGKTPFTTPRKEPDCADIYSGIFAGKTTGTPISIVIMNQDADSSKYDPIQHILRPGHANATYLAKYGEAYDHRGGGRASARETACRVAAAAVAKQILRHYDINVCAYLSAMGLIQADTMGEDVVMIKEATLASPIFCPDPNAEQQMTAALLAAKDAGDSLGGVVRFLATGLPAGLGDPIYEKLEANLAKAMLSLPASKGFEVGEGFAAAAMLGSTHNDLFLASEKGIQTQTNHAGGTLGGITTGMPLTGRVAFKPTSSIRKPQQTTTVDGEATVLQLPEESRHDPCVAIRAVPVVEAMCALVLVDALLMNRCARLEA
ncbi:MAG: chorismate synthase [Gammaproteobacteria bacterium]|nr:chorismate synthase [Gammaproteobacteria bacterium]